MHIFEIYYICQLFLSYKREIFILGVLGLLQQNLMAWSGLEPLSPTKISREKLQTTRENSGAQAGLRKFFSRILYYVAWVFANSSRCFYTCQRFLRYKHEIFILGVLGFLKTTRSFPKIPEEVWSLLKTSNACRRRSYRENAYPQNQSIAIYLFYTWF